MKKLEALGAISSLVALIALSPPVSAHESPPDTASRITADLSSVRDSLDPELLALIPVHSHSNEDVHGDGPGDGDFHNNVDSNSVTRTSGGSTPMSFLT
jgi:hypothetical protein